MKNRAKCKLCNDILESFHRHDFVTCKCGEISIDGGLDYLHCSAKDWKNFLRIDDNGHEIIVKVKNASESNEVKDQDIPILSRNEKIDMLEEMIKNIENLPQAAMLESINHYDLLSFMLTILAILKDEKKY